MYTFIHITLFAAMRMVIGFGSNVTKISNVFGLCGWRVRVLLAWVFSWKQLRGILFVFLSIFFLMSSSVVICQLVRNRVCSRKLIALSTRVSALPRFTFHLQKLNLRGITVQTSKKSSVCCQMLPWHLAKNVFNSLTVEIWPGQNTIVSSHTHALNFNLEFVLPLDFLHLTH